MRIENMLISVARELSGHCLCTKPQKAPGWHRDGKAMALPPMHFCHFQQREGSFINGPY